MGLRETLDVEPPVIQAPMGGAQGSAPATPALVPLRVAAEAPDRGDFSPPWCDENASGCGTSPAGEVTREHAGV